MNKAVVAFVLATIVIICGAITVAYQWHAAKLKKIEQKIHDDRMADMKWMKRHDESWDEYEIRWRMNNVGTGLTREEASQPVIKADVYEVSDEAGYIWIVDTRSNELRGMHHTSREAVDLPDQWPQELVDAGVKLPAKTPQEW